MLSLINGLALFIMLILVIFGAIYVCEHEQPLMWERIHVFAIGLMIYLGILIHVI